MKKFNLHKWLQEQRDLKSKRPINPSDKEDKKFGVFARDYEPRKGEEKDEPLKRGDDEPTGPPPDGDCVGRPEQCPEGQTWNWSTCKCEGTIDLAADQGREDDNLQLNMDFVVCNDPNAVNYDPTVDIPDIPAYQNASKKLCWYLTGCEDPISATYVY